MAQKSYLDALAVIRQKGVDSPQLFNDTEVPRSEAQRISQAIENGRDVRSFQVDALAMGVKEYCKSKKFIPQHLHQGFVDTYNMKKSTQLTRSMKQLIDQISDTTNLWSLISLLRDVKVKPSLLAHSFGPCIFRKADILNYGHFSMEKMQQEKNWILASKAIVTLMIEQCDTLFSGSSGQDKSGEKSASGASGEAAASETTNELIRLKNEMQDLNSKIKEAAADHNEDAIPRLRKKLKKRKKSYRTLFAQHTSEMTALEQQKKNLVGQIDEAAKQYKFEDCIAFTKELEVVKSKLEQMEQIPDVDEICHLTAVAPPSLPPPMPQKGAPPKLPPPTPPNARRKKKKKKNRGAAPEPPAKAEKRKKGPPPPPGPKAAPPPPAKAAPPPPVKKAAPAPPRKASPAAPPKSRKSKKEKKRGSKKSRKGGAPPPPRKASGGPPPPPGGRGGPPPPPGGRGGPPPPPGMGGPPPPPGMGGPPPPGPPPPGPTGGGRKSKGKKGRRKKGKSGGGRGGLLDAIQRAGGGGKKLKKVKTKDKSKPVIEASKPKGPPPGSMMAQMMAARNGLGKKKKKRRGKKKK